MTLFKDRYRVESARLIGWNYAEEGWYFVTLCTGERSVFFGDVIAGEMVLSEIGTIANTVWLQISEQFPNVILDRFIIMPNHIHGILAIHKNETDLFPKINSHPRRNAIHRVWTNPSNLTNHSHLKGGITGGNNPMLSTHSLSKIIRWYKGRSTFQIRSTTPHFQWQSRFHEHIIRNETTLNSIRDYIETNPQNWEIDRLHPSQSPLKP